MTKGWKTICVDQVVNCRAGDILTSDDHYANQSSGGRETLSYSPAWVRSLYRAWKAGMISMMLGAWMALMLRKLSFSSAREHKPTKLLWSQDIISMRIWVSFGVISLEQCSSCSPFNKKHGLNVLCCRFSFFHCGERIKKYPDSLPNLPDECEWKLHPERKSCGFKISAYV